MACSLLLVTLLPYTNQGWYHPQWARPSSINHQPKRCPPGMLIDKSNGGNSSTEVSSSHVWQSDNQICYGMCLLLASDPFDLWVCLIDPGPVYLRINPTILYTQFLKFLILFLIFRCTLDALILYIQVFHLCTMSMPGAPGGQRKELDVTGLELQRVVNCHVGLKCVLQKSSQCS